MPKTPALTDQQFAEAWHAAGGSPAQMAKNTGRAARSIISRRDALQRKGYTLTTVSLNLGYAGAQWAYPRTVRASIADGHAVLYSDAHYWPGEEPTPAFRAMLRVIRTLKPKLVIANGDLIDGAKISRHPRIAWARNPGVAPELAEVQARQAEVAKAAKGATLFRTVGNHDIRFDNWLAQNAAEFEGVSGMRLADHLPAWPESWSVRVNNDLIVKHRLKGGIHAAWNNVVNAGISIATGHLHRLECRSFRAYGGARRWGIETGTLAVNPGDLPDAGGGPFEYLEDAPVAWCSGFAVLTWRGGVLLPPEMCSVENGVAYFRGAVVS